MSSVMTALHIETDTLVWIDLNCGFSRLLITLVIKSM